MELCVAKLGIVKGARVCSFIASWCIASNALGRAITIEEYAEWWREDLRTSYRHQARFREVFPQLANPQRIADDAMARQQALSRGVNGIGSLPTSVVLA
jgi:hypothetical protein